MKSPQPHTKIESILWLIRFAVLWMNENQKKEEKTEKESTLNGICNLLLNEMIILMIIIININNYYWILNTNQLTSALLWRWWYLFSFGHYHQSLNICSGKLVKNAIDL